MLQILGETLLLLTGNANIKSVRPAHEPANDKPRLTIWRRPNGTPRLG